jgi:NAD(P)-dependent dehydrogenase (short-subunit alcohol dehydrogenase family)
MSSGQGSVANNTVGKRELYRGSKAALNMFMRSFAARRSGDRRSMVLMAPGWVRTEMGKPGLHYLDYLGRTVPW